jgi:glucokinase
VVGADVGGTNIRAAAALLDGTIVAETQVRTDPQGTAVIRQIADLVGVAGAAAGLHRKDLLAVALGVPGVPEPVTGRVRCIPNLPALSEGTTALTSALGVPTVFENDVNAAALGEWRTAGCRVGIMTAIALGTGIGMGIVIDGHLLRGQYGAAGEIADLPFGGSIFSAPATEGGMLESVVSTAGLLRVHRRLGGSPELADGAQVICAAQAGNRQAVTAVRIYTRYVARAITAVRAVLDPGTITLTGGIGSEPVILDSIREWLSLTEVPPELVVAGVLGARSGVVGATHLAIDAALRASNHQQFVASAPDAGVRQ